MFFDNAIKNKHTSINEVYIGKTKELQEMERLLNKYRNKHMGKYILNIGINTEPEIIKFNRLVEQFFGFGCCVLTVVNNPMVNAYTIPIDYAIDAKRDSSDIIVDERSFKFKKEYDYSCMINIYSGIIFNPNFTTEEIMACILHEIGHNFNSALSRKNGVLTDLFVSINTNVNIVLLFIGYVNFDLIANTVVWKKFVAETHTKIRDESKFLSMLMDVGRALNGAAVGALTTVNDIARVLTFGIASSVGSVVKAISTFNNPTSVLSILFMPLTLSMKYKSERTADNFATMYGYGAALSSLCSKLSSKERESTSIIMNTVNHIPLLSTFIHLNELPGELLLTAFDEHPSALARIQDQINLLEREASKADIDPKMKKVIQEDVKVCRAELDKLISTKKGIKDPYLAKRVWYKFLCETNTDLKKYLLDSKDKFDEYDRIYNSKIQ